MRVETSNLAAEGFPLLEEEAHRALDAALDRFEPRIRRVRLRIVRVAGSQYAICRVRAWCGEGGVVTVETIAATHEQAIHAAARKLKRTLRERWSRRRGHLH